MQTTMSPSELDEIYTAMCYRMTALGEPNASLYLARVALLALSRHAGFADATRLLDEVSQSFEETDNNPERAS
ncbi:hypothetical protein [Cupriavidus sp. D39]|uniref:hypothetical protein n=1 Tax=Cupriavidus sp. D39 TaxID=2997877 RepID=UPI00227164FE|nr:hypothetical protein [Cupriavidus sp. D39]MCY0854462.1 hypothetical protein [Cupriavidus sp. D39]